MAGERKPTKKQKDSATNTLSDEEIDKYIEGIFDGTYNESNLPEFVYDSVVSYLKKGLYEGYGMTIEEAEGADLELLSELRTNVYMFSAAKTYAMTKEISSLLVDDDGNIRTKTEFRDIGREKYDDWNDNYGETEYSTAIGQAYMANKWQYIESQKDVLPMLQYSAIGDACDICMPLDGLTAPVEDPVWDKITPLNHFNCKCLLLQLNADDAIPTSDDEKQELYDSRMEIMSDIFKNNSGKTGMVFNEDHPYFEAARADKAGADNFGFDIPEKD